jgi:hypothetical protein
MHVCEGRRYTYNTHFKCPINCTREGRRGEERRGDEIREVDILMFQGHEEHGVHLDHLGLVALQYMLNVIRHPRL